MTSRPVRKLAALSLVPLLCLQLGACGGGRYASDDSFADGVGAALSIGTAALGVAAVAAGGSSGGYRAPSYSPPARTSTYTAPAGNGYSQKGAFDDCARLYGSAGMEQQARLCRQRSTNMGSLH